MILSPNFIKKILSASCVGLLISIFAISCSSYFINFSNDKIKKIESEDHQFCVSLGLDFGEDSLKAEIYWRCRIALAQSKIKDDAISPEDIRLNITIKQLIASITKSYNRSLEEWNVGRNSLFNNNDHNSCVTQGHKIDFEHITNATIVEDYFACRKRLIDTQQIIPPYHKTEYFKRPQDSYSIGFAINKRSDKEIAQFEAAKAKYPICAQFNIKTDNFKNCAEDYDDQKKCFSKIRDLRFKRELLEKTACQKKTYVRFPDSMLKPDNKKTEELAAFAKRADINNNSNFISIGIDRKELEQFKGEDSEEKKIASETIKITEKDAAKNYNTKNQLYTKVDLTRLRGEFAHSCQLATEPNLNNYSKKLQTECRQITEKWEGEKNE